MMPKIINIEKKLKKFFPKKFIFPHYAEALAKMEDKDFFEYILESKEIIWGSDTVGGLAYFGKKEEMENILKQSSTYLSKLSSRQVENQFYLYWNFDDYAMLLLYEDYSEEKENPYPHQENVLCVHFGAWLNDEKLWDILNEKFYVDDIMHWNVSGIPFDEKITQHKTLLEEMKKFILTIDNEQENE